MINYEDLMADVLCYITDEENSECGIKTIDKYGFKLFKDECGEEYVFFTFALTDEKTNKETTHTIALESLTGDVIYTDENIVDALDEPKYVSDLPLEMQEEIWFELNRSIMLLISDKFNCTNT